LFHRPPMYLFETRRQEDKKVRKHGDA
jgi:hypothetical protein